MQIIFTFKLFASNLKYIFWYYLIIKRILYNVKLLNHIFHSIDKFLSNIKCHKIYYLVLNLNVFQITFIKILQYLYLQDILNIFLQQF